MTVQTPPPARALTSAHELAALRTLAIRKRVLEVGSYDGASAVVMAETAESVHCVDPFVNHGHDLIEPELSRFLEVTSQYSNIFLHHGRSDDILPLFKDNAFDLVFIDGDHSPDQFDRDVAEGFRLAELLAVHDFCPKRPWIYEWGKSLDQETTRVVDWLLIVSR